MKIGKNGTFLKGVEPMFFELAHYALDMFLYTSQSQIWQNPKKIFATKQKSLKMHFWDKNQNFFTESS